MAMSGTDTGSMDSRHLRTPMGSLVKKQVYSTELPDGTVVTTTTTTKTKESTLYSNQGNMYMGYVSTPIGILRLIEIVFGFIIIGCASGQFHSAGPYHGALAGNTFVIVQACICVVITFCLFLLFILGFHVGLFRLVPWREIDLVYCVIAVILHLVAGCLESWYASGSWRPDCNQFVLGQWTQCPTFPILGFAAAFCFFNALLYLLSAYFASKAQYYAVEGVYVTPHGFARESPTVVNHY